MNTIKWGTDGSNTITGDGAGSYGPISSGSNMRMKPTGAGAGPSTTFFRLKDDRASNIHLGFKKNE